MASPVLLVTLLTLRNIFSLTVTRGWGREQELGQEQEEGAGEKEGKGGGLAQIQGIVLLVQVPDCTLDGACTCRDLSHLTLLCLPPVE